MPRRGISPRPSPSDLAHASSTSNHQAASSLDEAGHQRREMMHRWGRSPLSCRPCRAKKRRCDRQRPCSSCTLRNIDCQYACDDQARPTLGQQPQEACSRVAYSNSATNHTDVKYGHLYPPIRPKGPWASVNLLALGILMMFCAACRGWRRQFSTSLVSHYSRHKWINQFQEFRQ